MTKPTRRQLIAGTGTATCALVAGCSDVVGLNTEESDTGDSNDDDTLGCQAGYRHLRPELEERSIVTVDSDDPYLGFSLEVTPSSFEYGTDFTVTLTNSSERDLTTYAEDRLAIQWNTAEEWRTVTGVAEDHEWDESQTTVSPGEERSWELTPSMDDIGLEKYAFCTTPTPYPYRAVYWGFPHEPDSDPLALAAEFMIIDDEDD